MKNTLKVHLKTLEKNFKNNERWPVKMLLQIALYLKQPGRDGSCSCV